MLLPLHICIAVLSVVVSGIAYFHPTRRLFTTSYALTVGTIATGTLLIVQSPSHLGMACLSGLTYLALIAAILVAAHTRITEKA